jgi:site-specific recombinase XerD
MKHPLDLRGDLVAVAQATMTDLAPLVQGFFTDRLMRQRQASPHTIAAYRDTVKLLLGFAHQQTGRHPAQLSLADLDAPTIGAFLHHLETSRGNSTTTRNARLAAIHSLFRYAAHRAPEHAALIQRVLTIPPKRFDRAIVGFLTGEEARLPRSPLTPRERRQGQIASGPTQDQHDLAG